MKLAQCEISIVLLLTLTLYAFLDRIYDYEILNPEKIFQGIVDLLLGCKTLKKSTTCCVRFSFVISNLIATQILP